MLTRSLERGSVLKKLEIASRDSSACGTNETDDLGDDIWSVEEYGPLGGTGGDGKDFRNGDESLDWFTKLWEPGMRGDG